MPRWNSPKRRRTSSSASPDRYNNSNKRFVSRSRSQEKKRGPPHYNRSPSPKYRKKGSPVPKKKFSSNQRNRSFSPDDHYKDAPSKNKRSSAGYRDRSFSPETKRKRSVTPTKQRYDGDQRSDEKSRGKQNFSPGRYNKSIGGKGSRRRDSDDHYKKSSTKRDGKKGYKKESRSRSLSQSPPHRSGSKKEYEHQKHSKYDTSSSRKRHDIDPSDIRININTAKPSPPRNIFNVEELVIPRRKDEGTKPLFDRPELRQRSYYDTQSNLEEERRVVSVKKNTNNIEYIQNMPVQEMPRKQPPMQPVANIDQFQRNTSMFQYNSLSSHSLNIHGSNVNPNLYQQPQQLQQPQQHHTYSQIDMQPHNMMQNNLQAGLDNSTMYNLPTGDLRHCIKSRRSPKDQSSHSHKEKRSHDRTYQRSRSKSQQGTAKIKSSPGKQNINDRMRKLASPDESQSKLPNFRKELEEIQKEEWKYDPTNIPRSKQYFEHDDRERRNSVEDKTTLKSRTDFPKFKGRGGTTFRGFGRGLGFSSRGFRGRRGFAARGITRGSTFFKRGTDRTEPSWKHDKYDGKKGNKISSAKSNEKLGSKRPKVAPRKEQDKRPSSSRK